MDDDELLSQVRDGDRLAYGELYKRHVLGARRYARSQLGSDTDADDAVAEVFARLLQAIENGRGPTDTFAAYLFASLRHECARIGRSNARAARELALVAEREDQRVHERDHATAVAEAVVVQAALASLPLPMRDILVLTEVDQVSQREIAARLNEQPGTVAVRALRARRALGHAYLDQHVGIAGRGRRERAGCRNTRAHLAAFLRQSVGTRRRARIEEHLAACADCRAECAHLRGINGHLRVVGPSLLGWLRALAETARGSVAATLTATGPVAATSIVALSSLAPALSVPSVRPSGAEPAHELLVDPDRTDGPAEPVAAAPLGGGTDPTSAGDASRFEAATSRASSAVTQRVDEVDRPLASGTAPASTVLTPLVAQSPIAADGSASSSSPAPAAGRRDDEDDADPELETPTGQATPAVQPAPRGKGNGNGAGDAGTAGTGNSGSGNGNANGHADEDTAGAGNNGNGNGNAKKDSTGGGEGGDDTTEGGHGNSGNGEATSTDEHGNGGGKHADRGATDGADADELDPSTEASPVVTATDATP